MKSGKWIIFKSLILVVPSLLLGQDTLSPTQFLATAQLQKNIQLVQQKIDFQKNTDYTIPWFEKIEIRTETNDFELYQQEFALRISPNTKRQITAQNQFHQANIALSETEKAARVEGCTPPTL